MSGWIKFEKDIDTDPRVLRMAKALGNASVTQERFNLSHAVTQVCGGLVRLWVYADSHARDDDTLDMSAEELDEWLGIPGFCSFMPPDWLKIIGDSSVEVPNFQAKNGVEAKKKALTQKRVSNHRRNAAALQPEIQCNAPALPDQTRPDQTKTRPLHAQNAHARAGREGKSAEPFHGEQPEEQIHLQVMGIKAKYPKAHREDWITAEHSIRRLVREGITWEQLEGGVERYANCCRTTNRIVLNPARFFGDVDRPWSQEWATQSSSRIKAKSVAQLEAEEAAREAG